MHVGQSGAKFQLKGWSVEGWGNTFLRGGVHACDHINLEDTHASRDICARASHSWTLKNYRTVVYRR